MRRSVSAASMLGVLSGEVRKMKIEDHVYVDSGIAEVGPAISKWVGLVRDMYRDTNGEYVPYSYKERTNIGVLSNAAALDGWKSLEECASRKSRDGLPYHGRIDLKLWRNDRAFCFESKLTTNSPSKLPGRIKSEQRKALQDAKSLPEERGAERLAAVFVIPRFLQETEAEVAHREVQFVIDVCRGHNPQILAYTFPGRSARKSPDRMDHGKCAYGVILMGFRV